MDQKNIDTEDFNEDMLTHADFFKLDKNNWYIHTCVSAYTTRIVFNDVFIGEKNSKMCVRKNINTTCFTPKHFLYKSYGFLDD